MNQPVILSIRGQQTVDGSEPEVVELVTEGVLSGGDGGGFTLSYQESELTGMDGTRTTFQVEGGRERVTLLREGQINSQMVFEEGRRHLSLYNTPYGALSVGVNTRRMRVRLDEGDGEIEIAYAIELDHAMAGENLFQISIKPRHGQTLPQ
jgi:uncharacterized beta-barrel protein YwiB (DUF1934 family)